MKKIKDMTKKEKKIVLYFSMIVLVAECVFLGMFIESIIKLDMNDKLTDEIYYLINGEVKQESVLTPNQICDTFLLSMYQPSEAKQALSLGLDKFCTPTDFIQSLIDEVDDSLIIQPDFKGGIFVVP